MNLSKIAVGVAVSLCLMSNVALAESVPAEPVAKAELSPGDSAVPKNKYTKTLEEKAKEKFDELSKKLELEKLIDSEPLDFEGERLRDLFDAYGYGSSAIRLEKVKNNINRAQFYYPFKLLNDEINDNKKQLDENLEGLKIANGVISKVSSEKADIKDVQKNTAGIAENKKSIATNKTSIDANKVSIEGNKKLISEINAKIALDHKAIQNVKSQLNNLNKDLRRGLATQSALNGLFQPYSVGKMNVTAAVGGYQSEKAIAIGTGYRFNEKLAAKAGLSKSMGGSALSYNMGVNYEF